MIGKFFKFEASSIVLLVVLMITIFLWVFFNLYYNENQKAEINPKLLQFSEKKYPPPYDENFIREYYKLKDKVYDKENK